MGNAWSPRRRNIPRPQVCHPPLPPVPVPSNQPPSIQVFVRIIAEPDGNPVSRESTDNWLRVDLSNVYDLFWTGVAPSQDYGYLQLQITPLAIIVTVTLHYEDSGGEQSGVYVATLPGWDGVSSYAEEVFSWDGPGFQEGECHVAFDV